MAGRRFGDGAVGGGAEVPVGDVLDDGNHRRIVELVALGPLVSMSRSRDGGAVSITVTFDGTYERDWFRNAGDAAMKLDEWLGLIEEAAREGPPPATRERRTRGR